MEKRKRYTFQVKTEVSQSAAYFIDQIVEKSHGYYKSRSDFVKEALLCQIQLLKSGEDYLSKEEIKILNRGGDRLPRIDLIEIPSTEIINSLHPVGRGKRKRYNVQVGTEISKGLKNALNEVLMMIAVNRLNVYPTPSDLRDKLFQKIVISYINEDLYSVSNFLNIIIIQRILAHKPLALEYLSEKEIKLSEEYISQY